MFAERLISQPLSEGILIRPIEEDQGRDSLDAAIYRVARLFRALKMGIKALERFYKQLRPIASSTIRSQAAVYRNSRQNTSGKTLTISGNPITTPSSIPTFDPSVPIKLPACSMPHWNEFKDENGNGWTLYYVERLSPEILGRTVFKAWASDGQQPQLVVVKFCKRYGLEGHQALSTLGHAPKLLFCDQVDSVQCWAIVMTFVEGKTAETRLTEQGKTQLCEAVKVLHDKDLVFGDLRRPNVIVYDGGNKINLIDFEWCGKEGHTTYPADIRLTDQEVTMPWAETVLRGAKISKEHDLYLLNTLF